MISFEQACAESERSAASLAKVAASLVRTAKQLEKAAVEGDVQKIKKALDQVKTANEATRQGVRNAEAAWDFSDPEIEEMIRAGYEADLVESGLAVGLTIRRQDEVLVAFPSLVQILPEQKAVRIDASRVTAIRPSRIAQQLLRNQNKKPRFAPDRFMETLHNAFRLVVGTTDVSGTTLAEIYRVLTLLPGANRDYAKSDFARDLYFLEHSEVKTTKSGARLSLPASTGTKGSTSLFTFVGPDGTTSTYYGIKFTESVR